MGPVADGLSEKNRQYHPQAKDRTLARHSPTPPLEVGGKSSKEHRYAQPQGGHTTHKTDRKGETTSSLGTAAPPVQHKRTCGRTKFVDTTCSKQDAVAIIQSVFVDFVETKVLRADTRATLARDAISIRQDNTGQ